MNNIKLLDKYIAQQLVETFLMGVIIFTSIMFASDALLNLVKQISMFGLSFKVAILLIILNLPYIIVYTIPMAVLLSTIITINKLSTNQEITIMRACGISIMRISLPVFIFGLIAAGCSFFINEFVGPPANTQAKKITLWAISQKNIPKGKSNFSFKELDPQTNQLKRLFYFDKYKDKKMQGITVLDMSQKKFTRIIQSKYADSSSGAWSFDNGVAYTISKSNTVMNTTVFQKLKMNSELNLNNKNIQEKKAEEMGFAELYSYLNQNKALEHKKRVSLLIELYEKISLPITALVLTLVGIPLAITKPRAKVNRGLLFSIGVIFCYYIIRALSTALGESLFIPPLLAAWLPNLIIFTVGSILFYRKAFLI